MLFDTLPGGWVAGGNENMANSVQMLLQLHTGTELVNVCVNNGQPGWYTPLFNIPSKRLECSSSNRNILGQHFVSGPGEEGNFDLRLTACIVLDLCKENDRFYIQYTF